VTLKVKGQGGADIFWCQYYEERCGQHWTDSVFFFDHYLVNS